MFENINLVIDFVAGWQTSVEQTSATQTGDISPLFCLIAFAIMLCAFAIFFLLKNEYLFFLNGTVKGAHVKQTKTFTLTKNKAVFSASIIIFMILLISGLFAFVQAFANPENSLKPDTDKITATVNEDGTISFSDCNLTNISDAFYSVKSSSVNISEEAKSVAALRNTNLVIKGFDGVLFEGNPDGEPYSTEDLTLLPSNESTKLSFCIQNLDKESALALCGKSVFNITLASEKICKINYDNGDFPGASISGDVPVDDNLYHEGDPVIVKDQGSLQCIGHSFSGWKDLSTGTIYQPNDTIIIASCLTLSAVWTPNIYTIWLNPNGGTIAFNTYYVKYGVGWFWDKECSPPDQIWSILQSPVYLGDGYTFAGFKYNGVDIIDSFNKIVGPSTIFTEDTTLYADWAPGIYKISLNAGESATEKGTEVFYEKYRVGWYRDKECTEPIEWIACPKKPGFSFDGYRYNGVSVIDKQGHINSQPWGSYPYQFFTADTTLDAEWNWVSGFKISLDPGKGVQTSGTTTIYEKYSDGWYSNKECTEPITTPIEIPTKEHYTFTGYKSGSTDIIDSSGNIVASATTFTKETTLNAEWAGNVYKITLDPGEGIQTPGTKEIYEKYNDSWYSDEECTISITKLPSCPSKEEYTFAGYKSDGREIIDLAGEIKAPANTFTEGETLDAIWAPNSGCKISLNAGEGTSSPGTQTIYEKFNIGWYFDKECTIPIMSPIDIPKKTSYTFNGYKSGSTEVIDTFGNIVVSANTFTEDTILTAEWTENVYEIKLNPGEGTTKEGTLVIYEKYNTGWFYDDKCTNPITGSIDVPEKTGYAFNGYKSGSTEVIDASGNIIVPANTFAGDTILTAEWAENIYEIKLSPGEGTTKEGTPVIYEKYNTGWFYDDKCINPITGSIDVPEKTGNTFKGYMIGSTNVVDASGSIVALPTTFSANSTLNAEWTADIYTIYLNPNGGIIVFAIYYVKYGEGWFLSPECLPDEKITSIKWCPTLRGYSFAGFKYNGVDIIDESGKIVGPSTIFTENTTLYADWSPGIYEVTLNAGEGATEKGTETIYEKYGIGFYSNAECTEPISLITCPSKPGFIFAGYMYASYYIVDPWGDIVEPSYAPQPYTSFDVDATLAAIWNPIVYNDSFGDREDGLMSDMQTLQENYNSSFLSDAGFDRVMLCCFQQRNRNLDFLKC